MKVRPPSSLASLGMTTLPGRSMPAENDGAPHGRSERAVIARSCAQRRDVAIRDFFDVDHAVRTGVLAAADRQLLELVRAKLAVPGNTPVDVSPSRLTTLRGQLRADLLPVLRPADFEAFDLDRAFGIVSDIATALGEGR